MNKWLRATGTLHFDSNDSKKESVNGLRNDFCLNYAVL